MAPRAERDQDPEYLSTLERGLSVLRAFNQERPQMQLSEVATVTSLSPAVARRCLNTLVKLGYVAKHGRQFLLRPEVLLFASAYLGSMNLEQVVTPYLQAIRDETGDSTSLAVLSGDDILYLVHVSTNRRFRIAAGVGTRFPAYATSLGKALLAFEAEETRSAYLKSVEITRFTEHTVKDAKGLAEMLRAARIQGYASSLDELDYGIVSVALPVLDAQRQVVAAINCSTSTSRISREELIETRLPLLRNAAEQIEASLRQWPFLTHSIRSSS